jgi:nicotinate-nucleotide adenylyltransferase
MNIGFFGGTFDPIHRGHLALAQAAKQRFRLGRIYFVPANSPPHKLRQPITPYFHRYAMVALATQADKTFVPSLLEAPSPSDPSEAAGKKGQERAARPNYSIDTLRRLKQSLKTIDQLFFLIGVDAFNDIAKWHEAEALFGECEFVVASRPGHSLADIANALPESLRPRKEITIPFSKQPAKGDLVLPGATLHLLEDVHHNISATAIREAVSAQRPLTRLVEPAVADYIKKMELYKAS